MPLAALLLIDLQANMLGSETPVRSAGILLNRIGRLLERARSAGIPVIFVRNCGREGEPDAINSPGWQLHSAFRPNAGELILDKTTSDTFASTPLEQELRRRGVARLIVAGVQSEFCVQATIEGALVRGFAVTLVADCHSTYDGKTRTATQISDSVNESLKERVTEVLSDQVQFE